MVRYWHAHCGLTHRMHSKSRLLPRTFLCGRDDPCFIMLARTYCVNADLAGPSDSVFLQIKMPHERLAKGTRAYLQIAIKLSLQ